MPTCVNFWEMLDVSWPSAGFSCLIELVSLVVLKLNIFINGKIYILIRNQSFQDWIHFASDCPKNGLSWETMNGRIVLFDARLENNKNRVLV